MANGEGHTQEKSTSGMLVAFVAGAAACAVAGLLLAPQSGRESRKQLGNYAGEAGEACKTFMGKSRSFIDEQSKRLGKAIKGNQEGMQAEQESSKSKLKHTA